MIEISRSLIRTVRSMYRRAGIGKTAGLQQQVQLTASADGLCLRGLTREVALEYSQPGTYSDMLHVLPTQFLEDCEGGKGTIRLEASDRERVTASWTDRGVPQLVCYALEPPKVFESFPAQPDSWTENTPDLLTALRAAADTTEHNSRYALSCVQVQGAKGTIVATDGRQAYWHSGLSFPWTDDLLLPASPVWRSSEFTDQENWQIGQSSDWIALRAGQWTLWQRIDREGRFPRMDDVLPSGEPVAQLELGVADADFLAQSLCKLPFHDEHNQPVTIDLNGHVAVRAKDAEGRVTEVLLAHSRFTGEATAISTHRRYFERAVQLGIRGFAIYGAGHLVLCDDGRQKLLWMLQAPNDLIKAKSDMVCISTAGEPGHTRSSPTTVTDPSPRRHLPVSTTTSNRVADRQVPGTSVSAAPAASATASANSGSGTSPIQQASALLASLNDAARNTRELIRALRRQKKQSRLVQSTLASLRQLKEVA